MVSKWTSKYPEVKVLEVACQQGSGATAWSVSMGACQPGSQGPCNGLAAGGQDPGLAWQQRVRGVAVAWQQSSLAARGQGLDNDLAAGGTRALQWLSWSGLCLCDASASSELSSIQPEAASQRPPKTTPVHFRKLWYSTYIYTYICIYSRRSDGG